MSTELARLSLERRAELAPLARDTAAAVARFLSLSPEDTADLELAVGEAVANALTYGDRSPVEISFTLNDGQLIIDVVGNTRGFLTRESATMPDTAAERGRGLPILTKLMDSVRLITVEDGVALRLEKQLTTPET
jgi:anti-sigma regulatory factor (Ser/Thr protein kinase)